MRYLRLMLTILLVGSAASARADSSAGGTAFDFLNFDASARAVALGGAYTALSADSSALIYNPAGLARVRAHEATFMHNQYAQGLTQDFLGFAARQGFGFQLNTASLNDIPRTTISQPGGTGSSFGISDLALGAGYGFDLGEDWSVGAAGKFIRETIDNVSATGGAVDAGVLYRASGLPGLTFGSSLLNVGPAIKFMSASQQLPTTARLGGAYAFSAWDNRQTAVFDVTKTITDKVRFGIGYETMLQKSFALRGGFTTRNDAGIGVTAGVGWSGKNFAADYAIVPMGDVGLTHRLSVTVRWGEVAAPTRTDRRTSLIDDPLLRAYQAAESARGDKDCESAKNLYREVITLAQTAGRKDDVVADAYTGIGLCVLAEGKDALALRFFKKALGISTKAKMTEVARRESKRLSETQP